MDALVQLFSSPSPPRRQIRPSNSAVATFGLRDASGQGFGHSWQFDDSLHYSHGQWRHDITTTKSSNYRELLNLVLAIEEAASLGCLADAEIFLFTDNSTSEAAFHKGTSSDPELFQLILRLRMIQMAHGVFIHVLLVAGTRMIAQGTDGLSRGSLNNGVLGGASMLHFVPFHLSALDRSPSLQNWVSSWATEDQCPLTYLNPLDWFTGTGHSSQRSVWTPPPAAADAALSELARAVHKRPHLSHIILIPRLMTYHWRRLFGKLCNLQFTIPLGCPFWPVSSFEPLIVGVVFPFLPHRPWRLHGTPFMDRVARQLSSMPPADHTWGRDLLRQLFQRTRVMPTLPPSMVWQMLHPS